MRLYVVNIHDITDDEYATAYENADTHRKEQVQRYRFERDRKLSLAADMLMRRAAHDYCKIATHDVIIDRASEGKPYIVNAPVYVSVSHSADYAVCAATLSGEVGVDIERVRAMDSEVISRICCISEIEYIGTSSKRAFEVWTAKEAYVKHLGTGIDRSLCQIDTCNHQVRNLITSVNAVDGYAISVCAEKKCTLKIIM